MKASVTRPDGTAVEIEGTAEEVAEVLASMEAEPVSVPTTYPVPVPYPVTQPGTGLPWDQHFPRPWEVIGPTWTTDTVPPADWGQYTYTVSRHTVGDLPSHFNVTYTDDHANDGQSPPVSEQIWGRTS